MLSRALDERGEDCFTGCDEMREANSFRLFQMSSVTGDEWHVDEGRKRRMAR